MQVMNGGDFVQKNVLLGGTGKTESFGVTNDPILMNMLSTGLYQKPLRTMIQETMFNAWDAHRMGNCQDKPIDIYINDTSGLIIRDYGPGIHKNEIHPIYCIYGNSTKRDNDDLTGGFGLGSKSPYAYADSFTVTSHHDGVKGMYIMNRVSEESNGGPGRSIIFEDIKTDESGLVVTIPLKNETDMNRAYEYIKDLMYLSGIKARIHFKDADPEEIFADTVPAGEWIVSKENNHGQIYAVYGGVRYRIINDDAYKKEFKFISRMSELLGNMYIGFKASTLTPLPSREGLNLNERTIATIKNQLEIMEENFIQMLTPATRTMIKESFKSLIQSGIEPKFLIEAWVRLGDKKNISDIIHDTSIVLDDVKAQCPVTMNQSMWNSISDLTYKRTREVMNMIGEHRFNTMKYIIWAKTFPNHKHYKNYIIGFSPSNKNYYTASMIENPISMKELIDAKAICDAASNQKTDLRVCYQSKWEPVENIRRAGHVKGLSHKKQAIVNKRLKDNKLKQPNTPYPNRLWFSKTGSEVKTKLLTKTIIVAKTISSLKDTGFKYQAMFSPNYPSVTSYHNFHRSNFGPQHYTEIEECCGAIIIQQRKDGYDNAVKALKKAGYKVYEADEPLKKSYTRKTTEETKSKEVPTYPLWDSKFSDWADWDNSVEDPTCYVCITEHKIQNGYSSDRPTPSLLRWVQNNTSKFVLLHNKARAGRLEKKGIPSFEEKIDQLVTKLVSNQERINKIVLHKFFMEDSALPSQLRELPEVQKFFNVPYIRTKEKEAFAYDLKILTEIENIRRNDWINWDTVKKVKESMDIARNMDSVFLVRSMIKKTNLFSEYALNSYLSDLKPGEIKCFSEKLMRFMRTI